MGKPARVIVLIGESGGGKTTVAQQLVAKDDRLIVVAPYMKTPYNTMGFTDAEAARAALVTVKPKKFRISVAAFTPKELGKCCRISWATAPGTLVLDETATVIPNAAAAPQELRYVAQIGRHAGHDECQEIRLVVLGQRGPNIPPFVRSEAKEIYLFALADEDDWLNIVSDFSLPGETRKRVLERGPRLPKYHRIRLTKREDGGWDYHEGVGT